jgi:subtilisin
MVEENSHTSNADEAERHVSGSVDELLAKALDGGGQSLETGRSIITFKADAVEEGVRSLSAYGVRVASASDFGDRVITLDNVGGAEAVVFPEVGAAVISGPMLEERGLNALADGSRDSSVEAIEPEYFVFPQADTSGYLRGFARAAEAIAEDLRAPEEMEIEPEEDPLVVGATWGLITCKVPPSHRSGSGIKVAIVDGGMDLGHPDFAGRPFVTQTFVGQPVQDLLGHATHICGTACGPKAPPGAIPRYGSGYKTLIHIGKVVTNSGSGTTATVLAGLNWAIGNRCPVILIAVGAGTPVQAAYTAAGAAALNKGCVIIAAAGHSGGGPTGAPANSPTIMAVASLEPTLVPSPFNSVGKIEIAAPGRDVFSCWPRPVKYKTLSGTSMAAAHVAGCAALWAETSPVLRGAALWKKLEQTAKPLPFPPAKVGKGLVQAPA